MEAEKEIYVNSLRRTNLDNELVDRSESTVDKFGSSKIWIYFYLEKICSFSCADLQDFAAVYLFS